MPVGARFKALASARLSAQTAAKKKKDNASFDQAPPATASFSAEHFAGIMALVAKKMDAREAKAAAAQAAIREDLMQEIVAARGLRQQQQQPVAKVSKKQAKCNSRGRAQRAAVALATEGIDVRGLLFSGFAAGLLCGIKVQATGKKATEFEYLRCTIMGFLLESCPVERDPARWKRAMQKLQHKHFDGMLTMFCTARNYGHGKLKSTVLKHENAKDAMPAFNVDENGRLSDPALYPMYTRAPRIRHPPAHAQPHAPTTCLPACLPVRDSLASAPPLLVRVHSFEEIAIRFYLTIIGEKMANNQAQRKAAIILKLHADERAALVPSRAFGAAMCVAARSCARCTPAMSASMPACTAAVLCRPTCTPATRSSGSCAAGTCTTSARPPTAPT